MRIIVNNKDAGLTALKKGKTSSAGAWSRPASAIGTRGLHHGGSHKTRLFVSAYTVAHIRIRL